MAHHLIEGSEHPDEIITDGKTDVNSTYFVWKKNNGILIAFLLRNIDTKVLVSLENVGSACKIWKLIEK